MYELAVMQFDAEACQFGSSEFSEQGVDFTVGLCHRINIRNNEALVYVTRPLLKIICVNRARPSITEGSKRSLVSGNMTCFNVIN